MNLTTLYEFIRLGELFPLRPGSKRPMKRWRWKKRNTTDPALILQWLESYPNSNWALIPTRCLVLDVDCKKGTNGFQSIEQYEPLPETLTVQTPSGGRHYYFQRPAKGAETINSLLPGIDVRADQGGYVVLPYSKTKSGAYKILEAGDVCDTLAPTPAWLEEILLSRRKAGKRECNLIGRTAPSPPLSPSCIHTQNLPH